MPKFETLTVCIDLGVGAHIKININELAHSYGPEYCTALLGFYIFTLAKMSRVPSMARRGH